MNIFEILIVIAFQIVGFVLRLVWALAVFVTTVSINILVGFISLDSGRY